VGHEAVAVDPATGFVYMTEDRGDGLFYRYRPSIITSGRKRPAEMAVGDLALGGTLEALRIVARPSARTQNWDAIAPPFVRGRRHLVDWVAIPDIEPDVDMERDADDMDVEPLKRRARTAPTSTRAQGFRLGAAQFARQEGITYHRGAVYICATNGGRAKLGQVWRLELSSHRLSLLTEPNDGGLLDGPDNITPAPNGDLIVCEDGKGEDFIVGITPHGTLYHLARNAFNEVEFAGATFSPDGRTLFVNVQDPGITFAIWGPWEQRRS
jgi:secreted PhoX family phosphatase